MTEDLDMLRLRTAGGHTPLLARPPKWQADAQCLDDWKAFAPAAPEEGEPREHEPSTEVAEQLCAGCPVIGDCLADAMAEEGQLPPAHRAGIRGGLTASARYELAMQAPQPVRKGYRTVHAPAGSDHPEATCPSGHLRSEFGYYRNKRWRCDECRRIADAAETTCSCGKVARRNTINTHRRRKGCAK